MAGTRGFDDALADEIINKASAGEKKEAWLVFDMDETLANWSVPKGLPKESQKDFFAENTETIMRPGIVDFFNRILDKDISIYFAIYSNTQKQERPIIVADYIKSKVVEKKSDQFKICFLFYNHFKGNPNQVEPKRSNKNAILITGNNGKAKYGAFRPNKLFQNIEYGYESCHPITDQSKVFFFDDDIYTNIKGKIGENYIHVTPYDKAKESKKRPATTMKNAMCACAHGLSGVSLQTTKRPKKGGRKTRRWAAKRK